MYTFDTRCSRNCLRLLSVTERQRVLENFNAIGDHLSQNTYLQALIKVSPVDQKRKCRHKRKYNFYYEVHVGQNVVSMCREGFASAFGIGSKRVRNIAASITLAVTPKDDRGKHQHRGNRLPLNIIGKIDEHIRSFPYHIAHYGSKGERRRYLSSELSVLKMYELFLEKYYPETLSTAKTEGTDLQHLKCDVKYSFYLKHFRSNYNYLFGRPRSDICTTCEELHAKISRENNESLKTSFESELRLHKLRAKLFYNKLNFCLKEAQEREEVEVLCFDFKQNIPCPHLATSDVFYKRQLWLYVMSVYSGKNTKSIMYTWPENIAKRGSNEVLSVLSHYIETFLPNAIKKLYVFTDGCRGQNHNQSVLKFWQCMILNGRFEQIKHYFPQRGHSFLPCDRHFAIIEKMQRKRERVESPDDWNLIIGTKFTVIEVNQNMVKDFVDGLSEPYFKKNVTANREKFQITKYKLFEFSATSKYTMTVSQSLNGFVSQDFRLLKPGIEKVPLPTNRLYKEELPIKPLKLQNIKELTKYLTSKRAISFYNGLKCSNYALDDDEED